MQGPSFFTLLYRYFFFGWLFKDTDRGDVFERAAAFRYNHEQLRWLPAYSRRWLVIGVALYALGGYAEILLGLPSLATIFYMPAGIFLPVGLLIGVAWLCMKALSRPPLA